MSTRKRKEMITAELEERAYEEETEKVETITDTQVPKENLMEKIEALETENAELKDKYLRSMAEFENFRRRSNQEKSDWIKLATQKLAMEVCDVADNFERALQQVPEADREHGFIKGILMIEQQLRNVLQKEGVCKIEALGKEFDPELHDALAHIPSEYDENLVAAVIQNGYTMHDKVLRPVRVAVSSGKIQDKPEVTEAPRDGSGAGSEDSGTIEIKID
jgi:molecular chaperone GrpE